MKKRYIRSLKSPKYYIYIVKEEQASVTKNPQEHDSRKCSICSLLSDNLRDVFIFSFLFEDYRY